jgi:putative intracellular protease/amidase
VDVAVLVYDGVDSAEALGPAQVLGRLPGARLWLVAADPGPKDGHNPPLHIEATHSVTQLTTPDIVLVPGGFGCLQLVDDRGLVDWVAAARSHARWTLAVSTGPVLLGAAGLLRGRRTTGHWLTSDLLRAAGAEPVHDRIVEEDGIVTAIGAAAAMEVASALAAREIGRPDAEAILAEIDFDPDASFDTTVPGRASNLIRRWNSELGDADAGAARGGRRRSRRGPRRVILGSDDHAAPD